MLQRLLFALFCAASLAACATLPPGPRDPKDPFESYNRFMFRVNSAVDNAVVLPTVRGYVKVVPAPMRHGVSRFLNNISYPRTLINDALQGKVQAAGIDTARLTVNTVLGLGFFDPATRMGLEAHDEDFGQTLGRWGISAGPYLMLPVVGPSTVRDALGRVPDEYTTGRHYIQNSTQRYVVAVLDGIDARANLLEAQPLLEQSFDRYAFVRNAWLKRREYLVHDGDIPDDNDFPADGAPEN
jgi:phospholipid-binding lipoprotein MlaA